MLTLRMFLIASVVASGALLCSPEPQEAVAQDSYWTNYWNWYDNDYRPYYNRRFRQNYNYLNGSGYAYGYNSPYTPYLGNAGVNYNPYLSNRYYDSRLNALNAPYNNGYYNYNQPFQRRNSVWIGDFQFSWR